MENFQKIVIFKLLAFVKKVSLVLAVILVLILPILLEKLRFHYVVSVSPDRKGSYFIPQIFYNNLTLLEVAVFLFLFIFFFLSYLAFYKDSWKSRTLIKNMIVTSIFLFIVFSLHLFLLKYLLMLNKIHYSNYLYSNFGIRPIVLSLLSYFDLFALCMFGVLLVESLFFSESKTSNPGTGKGLLRFILNDVFSKRKVFVPFVVLLLLIYQSLSSFFSMPTLLKEVYQDYSQRLGSDFIYVEALASFSPEDAVVIHPPQSNLWPLIGNQPVIRYFLFPRILVSGAVFDSKQSKFRLDHAYFVDIPASLYRPAWPKIDLNTNSVVFGFKESVRFRKILLSGSRENVRVFEIFFE